MSKSCVADAVCGGEEHREESSQTAIIVRERGHLPGLTEAWSRTTGSLETLQEEAITVAGCLYLSDGLGRGWGGEAGDKTF